MKGSVEKLVINIYFIIRYIMFFAIFICVSQTQLGGYSRYGKPVAVIISRDSDPGFIN
jgi:hypothetical protein